MSSNKNSLLHKVTDNHYQIVGDMSFLTATNILHAVREVMLKKIPLTLDLAQTKECASVSVALLLQLLEDACKQKIQLTYLNIPTTVLELAALSNVKEMLIQKTIK